MRVLLDECVPRKFKNALVGVDCQSVAEAGFRGQTNGRLLSSAETAGFDVLITLDRGIEFQQRISDRRIAVVVIRARSNRIADILPHVPSCLAALRSIRRGELRHVGQR